MARRLVLLVAVMGLGALFFAPGAHAAFGIEKWESLTCKENSDTPKVGEAPIIGEPPLAKDPGQCTAGTESKFFTQAAGHPNFGITDFTLPTLYRWVTSPEGRQASLYPFRIRALPR